QAAVDGRYEDYGRRDRAGDVDTELHNLDPDHRFHAAEVSENDHGDADQHYRGNRDGGQGLRRGSRLERSVNSRKNDCGEQQAKAVGDVSHHDEERRREHLDLPAESSIEKLVDRQQIAAKVRRDKQDRNDYAAQEISKDELQKLEVAAARERD